jgi:hypothetical protein
VADLRGINDEPGEKGNPASSSRWQIESFIAYFHATMGGRPFRWTMKGKPLVA